MCEVLFKSCPVRTWQMVSIVSFWELSGARTWLCFVSCGHVETTVAAVRYCLYLLCPAVFIYWIFYSVEELNHGFVCAVVYLLYGLFQTALVNLLYELFSIRESSLVSSETAGEHPWEQPREQRVDRWSEQMSGLPVFGLWTPADLGCF